MTCIPEFCRGTGTVYRTVNCIIKQQLGIVKNEEGDAIVVSLNTFYVRTHVD